MDVLGGLSALRWLDVHPSVLVPDGLTLDISQLVLHILLELLAALGVIAAVYRLTVEILVVVLD